MEERKFEDFHHTNRYLTPDTNSQESTIAHASSSIRYAMGGSKPEPGRPVIILTSSGTNCERLFAAVQVFDEPVLKDADVKVWDDLISASVPEYSSRSMANAGYWIVEGGSEPFQGYCRPKEETGAVQVRTFEKARHKKILESSGQKYNEFLYGVCTSSLRSTTRVLGREVSNYEIVLSILDNPNVPKLKDIRERLLQLYKLSINESDFYQHDMRIESLQSFVDFIGHEKRLRTPDIVLTPDGNVRATWKADANKFFRLEFLPSLEIRFVIFTPSNSKLRSDVIEKNSGLSMPDRVIDILNQSYKIGEWAFVG